MAAGDLVAVGLVFTGTHLGPWEGVEPSGARVRVAEMMMVRFEGDRIVAWWETFDDAGLRSQIGAAAGGERGWSAPRTVAPARAPRPGEEDATGESRVAW